MITRKDLMQFRMQEKLESLLTLTTVVANGSITGGSEVFSDANNNTVSDGLDRKYSESSISRETTCIERTSDETDNTHEVSTIDVSTQNASKSQKGGDKHKPENHSSADNGHDRDQFDCKPIEFAVGRKPDAEAAARTNNRPAESETGWETPL
jgi:hypothetical protein